MIGIYNLGAKYLITAIKKSYQQIYTKLTSNGQKCGRTSKMLIGPLDKSLAILQNQIILHPLKRVISCRLISLFHFWFIITLFTIEINWVIYNFISLSDESDMRHTFLHRLLCGTVSANYKSKMEQNYLFNRWIMTHFFSLSLFNFTPSLRSVVKLNQFW